MALFQLSRTVRDAGIRIVLTGEGSDEIFAGYAHYRRDLAIASRAGGRTVVDQHAEPTQPASVRPLQAGPPPMSMAPVRVALGFIPTWLHGQAIRGAGILDVLRPELATRLVRGEPFDRLISGLEISRQLRGRHPVHQSMLREVARPVITEAIYRRPKDRLDASTMPAAETGTLRELLHDTLRSPQLAATPFFDRARIVALLDSVPERDPASRAVRDRALLMALSVCVMQQRFGIHDAI